MDLLSDTPVPPRTEAIHNHFGLSYAQYLVLPRTALQSMPDEWQSKFVKLLEGLDEMFAYLPHETTGNERLQYRVQVDKLEDEFDTDEHRYIPKWQNLDVEDPLADYRRGRRRLEPRPGQATHVPITVEKPQAVY